MPGKSESGELGFETILNADVSKIALMGIGISEENYCPDCYDCVKGD